MLKYFSGERKRDKFHKFWLNRAPCFVRHWSYSFANKVIPDTYFVWLYLDHFERSIFNKNFPYHEQLFSCQFRFLFDFIENFCLSRILWRALFDLLKKMQSGWLWHCLNFECLCPFCPQLEHRAGFLQVQIWLL